MTRLLKWLSFLVKPISIGFYFTFFITYLAFIFYARSGIEREQDPLLRTLVILHQKSIDLRLQLRGERPPSDQVALLAIDEKAVATIGRWPWPREVLAKAINRAFEMGVKVMGFDIIFAEPSARPAEDIYKKLTLTSSLPPRLDEVFRQELELNDSDKLLSEAIAKYADQIVLGVFPTTEDWQSDAPLTNICLQLNYTRSRASQIWSSDAVVISPLDEYAIELPAILRQLYLEHMNSIEKSIRDSTGQIRSAAQSRELNHRIDGAVREYCENWLNPEKDELFEVIAGAFADLKSQEPDSFKQDSFTEWAEWFKGQTRPLGPKLAESWVMNIDEISKVGKHTGFFSTELDSDGTIRRKSLVVRTYESWMPSLALKSYLVANNYNVGLQMEYDERFRQRIIRRMFITDNETGDEVMTIPADAYGRLAINYAGPKHMFPHLSIADLLSEEDEVEVLQKEEVRPGIWEDRHHKIKKSEWLKNKILIVGATATGIYDLRVTPFDENFPGPETHLNVLDNLTQRNFLFVNPLEEVYMMPILLFVGLAMSIALTYLGAVSGAVLALGSLIGIGVFDRFYLFGNGLVVAMIFPILLIGVLYIVLTFYKYFTEERGKKELRATFQKYVSPAIVEEILADPTNIELGGRKMHLTVFFSDVRGFTTISEKLDPRALSDLLNRYLTPMTDLVFKNRGTLDKYMGDAVMAFFGAPIAYPDHAVWACRCALQSVEKLKELQKEFEAQGLPSIDLGIGLNTGEVSVGNMGSQTVRNYTVMGDAVNLASRLEGINKQYGTRIIISEFTYQEIKDQFICREVDWVRVKGKILPVKIYELVAEKSAPKEVLDLLSHFNEGYQQYHLRSFSRALESFAKALQIDPSDPASKLYVERCEDYIVNPPPSDWDGVFVMKSK